MAEEETTLETTPVTPVAPPVEPPREPAKTLHTCGHCGAKVVPEEHDTPTGKVRRCPKCGKFMKLESPEEVKARREEEKGPLPPYEVMLTERVSELLAEKLPRVHGIPKKETAKTIAAILDTLNPEAVSEPWNLHNHVKNFAPNADDRHLESIIKKIYGQLETEGYIRTGRRRHRPSYRGRRTREGYRPSYAHDEDYEDEDYEDQPRRTRRSSRMKVVVEGQEIETDYPGYLAHQAWKREQEEHEDRKEERDLRMKRIEAEILKITKETGGTKTESPTDKAEERRREEEHELRKKRLEAEILKITRETGGSTRPQGPYEEVREFIDAEGNLCDPEKAVSVRIKMIPMETKGLTAEEVRRIVREGREELTPEKVREIVRTESGGGESEEVKGLKQELGESRKSIEDLKGTIESKDRQVLLDKIDGLESRVSDLATTGAGDWKSDEIRLIKGSISDVKDLLKTYLTGERPLDRAERILTGGPAGTTPPSEMAGEAARGGVIQGLREHGLVTKIVERVRG